MCPVANVKQAPETIIFDTEQDRCLDCVWRKAVGLHSRRPELSIFDDFDRLVLAGLALKHALLRTGLVRFYARQPHRHAALGAHWMNDVL